MNKLIYTMSLLGVLALSGCAAQAPEMYYWGNYSHSLYDYKQTPGEESAVKHQQSLMEIIDKSQQLNLRVPPGVYCELGYLMAQKGEKESARKYLTLEKETYPESTRLVDILLAKL